MPRAYGILPNHAKNQRTVRLCIVYDKRLSMSEPILSQEEADRLIAAEKRCDEKKAINYPGPGGSICIHLYTSDRHERFHFDVTRGRIALKKVCHNVRVRTSIPLIRLDINGAPHTNPDGSKVGRSHLHLYREGYGDAWAFEVDPEIFGDVDDLQRTLQDFVRYCNIVDLPTINYSLF